MRQHCLRLTGLVLLSIAWSGIPCIAQPAAKASSDGLKVMHVGNSHSHALRLLEPLCLLTGHAKHKDGEINILGAPLRWNWDHPEQNKWQQSLAAGNKWDAITLLAWASDDETYAPKFAGEALKGNPQCQVFIYTIWPDANMDWEKPSPIRTEAHTEKVAAAVAKAFPDAPRPRVIPSSMLIRELGRLADAGKLPGLANRFVLFSDGGHLSESGMYAIDVLVAAMLYDESPLKYPSHYYKTDPAGKPIRGWYESIELADETASVIKRVAWDILQTYPPAGMANSLVIADRHLAPAVAGQPYQHSLKALNGTGTLSWSIEKGSLPSGLSLSGDGVISGKTTAAGSYPLTLKVSDGKAIATRTIDLIVSEDRPPTIIAADLKSIALDDYFFQELKASGGVGSLRWEVAEGKLPYGIALMPNGILNGTPGEAGDFRFTLKLADSHPAGPRSAAQQFAWTIAAPSPTALLVPRLPRPAGQRSDAVKLDGKLDEPCWSPVNPIAKAVKGNPAVKATFGAFWTTEGLYVGIKVMDGPAGKSKDDAVEIFLDARHNREVIYNADDMHVVIRRSDGKATFVKSHTPWWFLQSAAAEIDGGYCIEMRIGTAYFLGKARCCRSRPSRCTDSTSPWMRARRPQTSRCGAARGGMPRTRARSGASC